jgi:2-polyprenyl-6-methoxyphenol hydroxylase-like FAD-dependent oxidoreductase
MSTTAPFHVVIIGGGLGGLCLAQGLHKAGIGVAVYERDRTRTDRLQGYRVHINPAGSRALHQCMPPDRYNAFVATCGEASDGFSFYTEQLQELLYIGGVNGTNAVPDPVDSHKSVSRITLRQVLLEGLDEIVHFDKEFTGYDRQVDGTIVARFTDGTTATGDVLVAADGANSRVRKQYLPHAQRIDTGVVSISGKVPLADETSRLLPPNLAKGPASIVGPGGLGIFLAVQKFRQRPAKESTIGGDDAAVELHPGLLFDNTSDYIMWALGGRGEKFPFSADPETLDGCALREIVAGLVKDWNPHLRQLVCASDPSTVSFFPIRTSVPIDAWQPTTVTLLGDAIHSMTPMRGIGANTALRDAGLLCRNLIAASRGERPLLGAIGDYEAAMREYGFAAVRSSRKACDQSASDNPIALAMMKTSFRVLNAVPPLKRRVFANMGNG